MRILMWAGYYHPHIGGYIKNVHELARRLAARGHRVDVATCNTERAKTTEVIDGVRVVRLSSWELLNGTFPVPKPTALLVHSVLRKCDYDVVVTQTRFFATSLAGLLYAQLRKLPLVHVERGSSHSVLANPWTAQLAKLYDHTAGSRIVRSAQANVAVSRAAAQFVRHLGGTEARVIYNGADVASGSASREQRAERRIIFVGRLVYAKGVQDLITAFEYCCRWLPYNDLRLIIVGDGNYRGRLERQTKSSGYQDKITFLGELSHERVMAALSAADILVNPSYSEGLPTCVVEAACCGLPVVATAVGGTEEVVDARTGILVAPYDADQLASAIVRLVTNRKLACEMGQQARDNALKMFDWDAITTQWEQVLEEVVQARRRDHALKERAMRGER